MRYCILYLPHVNEEVMVAASRELTTMKGASSEDEINTWRKAEWKNWSVTDIWNLVKFFNHVGSLDFSVNDFVVSASLSEFYITYN